MSRLCDCASKLVFFVILLMSGASAFAQIDPHVIFDDNLDARAAQDRLTHSEEKAIARDLRKKRVPGFGASRSTLRAMCEYMERDGRRELFHQVVEERKSSDELCVACRSLYKDLASSCRSRKKKSNENDGGEDPVVYLAREPRLEVIDLGVQVMHQLFSNQEFRAEYTEALFDLRLSVAQHPSLTIGAKEYFELFFEYLLVPFVNYADRAAARRAAEAEQLKAQNEDGFREFQEPDQQTSLDALFDF